jgi:hypothetical protein
MRTIIVIAVLAVVLFGLSFGASHFLGLMQQGKAKKSEETAAADTSKELPPLARERPGGEGATRSTGRFGNQSEADATVQMSARLREQEANLAKREEQLKVRARAMDVIAQDIRNERDGIDRLRRQITEEMKGVCGKLDEVHGILEDAEEIKRHTQVQAEEMKRKVIEADTVKAAGFKTVGAISDRMPAADLASLLQVMAESGSGGQETGAQLLVNMQERKAADVLAQIPDKGLAAQIMEKMLILKRARAGAANGGTPNR